MCLYREKQSVKTGVSMRAACSRIMVSHTLSIISYFSIFVNRYDICVSRIKRRAVPCPSVLLCPI